MKLLQYIRRSNGDSVHVFARDAQEAMDYLKSLPMFWHWNFEAAHFQEIATPKGPSPSVLCYSFHSSRDFD